MDLNYYSKLLEEKRIELYKTMGLNYLELNKKSISNRRRECTTKSKTARQNLTMANRKLDVRKSLPNTPKNKSRQELLEEYKKKKEIKKKEATKKKPLFLVSHSSGIPSLANMCNFSKRHNDAVKHTFKPPSNIKPIKGFKIEKQGKKVEEKAPLKRAKKIIVPSNSSEINNKRKEVTALRRSERILSQQNNVNNLCSTSTLHKIEEVVSGASPKNQQFRKESTSECLNHVINTPENITNNSTAVTYISPFVTFSRGKSSARREYHERLSQGGTWMASPKMKKITGPKAAANYFRNLLQNQILIFKEMCDEWTKYKAEENLPDGADDMINVTIGQTQLLLNKKFKQFEQLITNCELQNSEPRIVDTDLHGFWDMLIIQVQNINDRFANLKIIRNNNWQEIIPEKKKISPKKIKIVKKKKVEASSSLKNMIRAARQKAKQDESCSPIKTPRKSESEQLNVLPTNRRSQSLHKKRATPKSVMKTPKGSERKNNVSSSKCSKYQTPWRVSAATPTSHARMCAVNLSISSNPETPPRSILKSRKNSTKSKSVLFVSEDLGSPLNNKTPQRLRTRSKLF